MKSDARCPAGIPGSRRHVSGRTRKCCSYKPEQFSAVRVPNPAEVASRSDAGFAGRTPRLLRAGFRYHRRRRKHPATLAVCRLTSRYSSARPRFRSCRRHHPCRSRSFLSTRTLNTSPRSQLSGPTRLTTRTGCLLPTAVLLGSATAWTPWMTVAAFGLTSIRSCTRQAGWLARDTRAQTESRTFSLAS